MEKEMGCYVLSFCKVLFGSQIIHWKELIPAGIGKNSVFLAGPKYERKTIYFCISDVYP